MRDARQRQSEAVFVASSTTNPLPSHSPSGQAPASRGPARLRGSALIVAGLWGGSWWGLGRSWGVAVLAGVVHELRVLLLECERNLADGTIPMLGDDQVRLAGSLGILVVVLVAVDEHHQIGVLLEVPRLAQVRELWTLVRPRLHRTTQLGEGDHRHAKLACQDLQSAAQLTYRRHARVIATVGSHQLQVVDDDQAKSTLALRMQPAGLRPDLEHAHVA